MVKVVEHKTESGTINITKFLSISKSIEAETMKSHFAKRQQRYTTHNLRTGLASQGGEK